MKKLLKYLLIFGACALTLNGCGVGDSSYSGGSDSANQTSSLGHCTPNVVSAGLNLQVQPITLGSSNYSFQVCNSTLPYQSVFSIYAAARSSDLDPGSFSPQAAIRGAHIEGAMGGQMFQVSFLSTDNYFAIYRDSGSNGNYYLDTTRPPLVLTHSIPQ